MKTTADMTKMTRYGHINLGIFSLVNALPNKIKIITDMLGIEKLLFEELVRMFEYFEHRVMEICSRKNDRTLHKWMDNQDVCRYLNCRVSSRKLRTEEKRLFTEVVTYNS